MNINRPKKSTHLNPPLWQSNVRKLLYRDLKYYWISLNMLVLWIKVIITVFFFFSTSQGRQIACSELTANLSIVPLVFLIPCIITVCVIINKPWTSAKIHQFIVMIWTRLWSQTNIHWYQLRHAHWSRQKKNTSYFIKIHIY